MGPDCSRDEGGSPEGASPSTASEMVRGVARASARWEAMRQVRAEGHEPGPLLVTCVARLLHRRRRSQFSGTGAVCRRTLPARLLKPEDLQGGPQSWASLCLLLRL